MRYAAAEILADLKETAYRTYVTDALSALIKSQGGSINARWIDIVSVPAKKDDRSGDEIAFDIIRMVTGEEVHREPT